MIAILPSVAAVVLFVLAFFVAKREASPRRARSLASIGIGSTLALVLLVLASTAGRPPGDLDVGFEFEHVSFTLHPQGLLGLVPLVVLLVGLLAVSLAPVASHPPRTLARIVRLLAIATAFVALHHPYVLAFLFGCSAFVMWRELVDRREVETARLFVRYHLPATVLVVIGAFLLVAGQGTAGVVCWLLGIAVREAVVPVHGWLPALTSRAPLGLVVAFVSPQLGVYAHLQMLTNAIPHTLAHEFAAVGAVTAVLAACLGLVQQEARRAFAYLVMSQTGLVAFGLENDSIVGLTGALLSWQVLALATSGFAMTLAALEARRGHLSLRVPGGSFARTPRMAVAFLFLGFAGVGLPATLGFIAEDLLVQGSAHEYPQLGFALILATALNGMNVMRCFFTLFSGSRDHIGETDLTRIEATALSVVMGVLLVGGVFPKAFLVLGT